MPKQFSIIDINGVRYVQDDQLDELRNVSDEQDRIPFEGPGGYSEYHYWIDVLQVIVGKTILNVSLQKVDENIDGWFPVLTLSDGKHLILTADEEGNGPGRCWIEDSAGNTSLPNE